ncbi:MAG TPA: hypothetical protein VE085_12875 [Burkholderiales bacterium]|nr:hypothetical protein [Burkholderiales bacterium]
MLTLTAEPAVIAFGGEYLLVEVWYLSGATNAVQALISLLLVMRWFRVRLASLSTGPEVAMAGSGG